VKKYFSLVALLIIVWGILSLALYSLWVHGAYHRDFFPLWTGARFAIFDGYELYAHETTQKIQIEVYGELIPEGKDQQGFSYPAQLLVILLPFWCIDNMEIAAALWEGWSVILLVFSLFLVQGLWKNRIPAWGLLVLTFWYYPLLMVYQGQFPAIAVFSLACGYRAFNDRNDILSGIIFSLGIIKPELVLVPYIVFLIIGLKNKRIGFILSFMFSQIVLLLFSFVLAGWWLPSWVQALTRYASYAQPNWALNTALQLHPLVLIALLSLVVFTSVFRHTQESLIAMSVPWGLILIPQTLMYGLTILLIPMALCWQRKTWWAVMVIWAIGWTLLALPPDFWRWQVILVSLPALGMIRLNTTKILLMDIRKPHPPE